MTEKIEGPYYVRTSYKKDGSEYYSTVQGPKRKAIPSGYRRSAAEGVADALNYAYQRGWKDAMKRRAG